MARWQDRMAELVSVDALRPLMESLAAGGCTDEGEKVTDWEGLHPGMNRYAEDRKARVEWDADARLWLVENADASVPAEYRAAMRSIVRVARARKYHRILQRIAASFEDPDWVPSAKDPEDAPEYAPKGDARDLKTKDFYGEVVAGAAALVRDGWSPHKYPEREHMRRMAAKEVNWQRANRAERGAEKDGKEIAFDKAFNKLQKRFHDQRNRVMAKRRVVTGNLPT